jgi:F-type H+-transporting ATPase subunit gamma
MAISAREIKRRIKSVKNIGQITKAMELVSAAKMRKAQGLATSSRPYAQLSSELLNNLAVKIDVTKHPLISRPAPTEKSIGDGKNLIIVITSDKGLAGSFNSNVLNKTLTLIKEDTGHDAEFISVGKKGSDALKRLGKNIIATFPSKDRGITILDAKPIAQIATEEFLHYRFDQVFVIYTDFISTLVQKANAVKILPVAAEAKAKGDSAYEFEPDPESILDRLVYRTLEFAIYQYLVESSASEHSARMVAMRNANQASEDLIDELTLSANQARQAGITRELAEISAAKLAMEG